MSSVRDIPAPLDTALPVCAAANLDAASRGMSHTLDMTICDGCSIEKHRAAFAPDSGLDSQYCILYSGFQQMKAFTTSSRGAEGPAR